MGIFIMKNQKTKQERFDYFAGLAMQSLILRIEPKLGIGIEDYIWEPLTFYAIEFAKEMIKQIDNEQI